MMGDDNIGNISNTTNFSFPFRRRVLRSRDGSPDPGVGPVQLSPTRWRVAAAGVVLLAVALVTPPVLAGRSTDPRSERAAVQQRRAELAGQLDVLSADMAEITEALEAIGRNVDAQRARVEDAQRSADQAEADADAARAEEQAKQIEIETLQDQQEQLLVDSYIREGTNQSSMDVLSGSDPTEAA